MLSTLSRKLCPLFSLALFTVGCGKPINDPVTQDSRTTNEGQPSSFELIITPASARQKNFLMSDTYRFKVPQRLLVRNGSPAGLTVEIKYVADPDDEDIYFFSCTYLAATNYFQIRNCENDDGNDLGNLSSEKPYIKVGDYIRMEVHGSTTDPDLTIEAIHSVE